MRRGASLPTSRSCPRLLGASETLTHRPRRHINRDDRPGTHFHFSGRVSYRLECRFGVRAFQALAGFTDTYAELVTKYPTLATPEARQATLQSVIFHEVVKWAIVAVPLGVLALIAKW
jgi:hypothetical protein